MAARVVMCSMVVVTQQQELSLCYDQIILALMSTSPPQSSGIVHLYYMVGIKGWEWEWGVGKLKMTENVH